MKTLRGITRITAFFIWSILLVPPQILLLFFYKSHAAYFIPQLWHKGVCRIMGLKTEIIGTPDSSRQTIYISNHISDLDIPVIGSVIRASFIAKTEVATWPVLGFLARIQQTAFISRSSKDVKHVKNALHTMLTEGKSLILFPEGTSSGGTDVLPFKSSLFSLLQDHPISLQPFTIQVIKANGAPAITQTDRDFYAYYGDIELAPHLWGFVTGKGATIRLTFHTPIALNGTETRKDLAAQTWGIISTPFQSTEQTDA